MDGSQRLTLRNRRHLRPLLLDKPVVPVVNRDQRDHNNTGNIQEESMTDQTAKTIGDASNDFVDKSTTDYNTPLLRRSTRTTRKPARFRN